ncbi:MAG: glycerophosphodiester phosphodiesterase family protein [Alphaproteobacteria bacterium]|nr:glycerophosphodiester phosphodiesterase family protein [Alphaproteobacteria bacterium]
MPSSSLDFLPPVIAHRGAAARAPENTLAAFEAAFDDGARWIETDVQLTSDGVPVLMHDDTLERTTSGRGSVAAMTWNEMQRLDAGSWFSPAFSQARVPSLTQTLAFAAQRNMRLNLELKPGQGRAQVTAMVALIEVAKIWPDNAPPPLITSFDLDALKVAAQMHPGWPRALLLGDWREDWRELATTTQASAVSINAALLTPERLATLRATSVPILAYTVNDPAQARDMLKTGVNAVISDNPREILGELVL